MDVYKRVVKKLDKRSNRFPSTESGNVIPASIVTRNNKYKTRGLL